MSVAGLLARLVAALNAAQVPYMLTGSYASSLHSVPRATQDIDIVIFPNRDQLLAFLQQLPAGEYHVDRQDALESLRSRRQFNIIDYATGWKVDFIIPPLTDFHVEEFERRTIVAADGLQLSVVSAEDIVIAKLLWAKAGDSDKQLRDVAGVLRIQQGRLDSAYIERWVRRLGIAEQWARAQAQAAG